MRRLIKAIWIFAIISLAVPYAASKPAAVENTGNSLVIIFKGSHQPSFPLADIQRIEFNPPQKALRTWSEANLSANGAGGNEVDRAGLS